MTTILSDEPLPKADDVSDYLNAVFPQLMSELEHAAASPVPRASSIEPVPEELAEPDAVAEHGDPGAPLLIVDAYAPSDVEQWREVVGHPGYLVSDRGNISGQRVATMALTIRAGRYTQVNLASSVQRVSKLVAIAFCQRESADKYQVDHINRDPTDDRAVNLRWVTASENMRNRTTDGKSNRARAIDQLTLDGGFIATWPSISAAVTGTHLGRQTIEHSLNGTRATRHFKFQYHVDVDLPDEVWQTITYKSTTVTVSNLGRVDVQGHKYFPRMSSIGHCVHGKCGVHVYVATAFIENPEGRTVILHRDNDRANNHVDNLEWSTMSKITQHAADTGQNGRLRTVRQLTLEGQLIATFPSIAAANRATGVSASHISSNCRGIKGRPSAGGYKWEFA